jgi:hypothetical protein
MVLNITEVDTLLVRSHRSNLRLIDGMEAIRDSRKIIFKVTITVLKIDIEYSAVVAFVIPFEIFI